MSDTRYRIGASETNDHTAGGRIGKARHTQLTGRYSDRWKWRIEELVDCFRVSVQTVRWSSSIKKRPLNEWEHGSSCDAGSLLIPPPHA